MYVYIYIYRERERCIHVCTYIYIYVYIEIYTHIHTCMLVGVCSSARRPASGPFWAGDFIHLNIIISHRRYIFIRIYL